MLAPKQIREVRIRGIELFGIDSGIHAEGDVREVPVCPADDGFVMIPTEEGFHAGLGAGVELECTLRIARGEIQIPQLARRPDRVELVARRFKDHDGIADTCLGRPGGFGELWIKQGVCDRDV